jgi:hypothetical protein
LIVYFQKFNRLYIGRGRKGRLKLGQHGLGQGEEQDLARGRSRTGPEGAGTWLEGAEGLGLEQGDLATSRGTGPGTENWLGNYGNEYLPKKIWQKHRTVLCDIEYL